MIQPNGFKKITLYVSPEQYFFLKQLTLDKVRVNGGGRPDMSQEVRGMIDHFIRLCEAEFKSKRHAKKSKG